MMMFFTDCMKVSFFGELRQTRVGASEASVLTKLGRGIARAGHGWAFALPSKLLVKKNLNCPNITSSYAQLVNMPAYFMPLKIYRTTQTTKYQNTRKNLLRTDVNGATSLSTQPSLKRKMCREVSSKAQLVKGREQN